MNNYQTPPHAGGVTAVIGMLQQMRLGTASQQQPPPPMAYNAGLENQTRGVVFPSAADEKRAEAQKTQAEVQFEELPSYDESTGNRSPASTPTVAPAALHQTKSAEQIYQPHQDEAMPALHRSNTDMMLGRLEQFRSGLQQYKDGAHNGKWVAKRAAKTFMRDLYDQEMEKRRSEKGHLACGERKQVRRELKPVKHMLKSAVWEAKRERKGCC